MTYSILGPSFFVCSNSLSIQTILCCLCSDNKKVTRSVLALELYRIAHGFDVGATIKSTIKKILRIDTLPLILYTDSKSLYDCLVKLGTTQEKRLIVDLMCLRQSYERREIAKIKWINGNSNPADAMTKSKLCLALKLLVDIN